MRMLSITVLLLFITIEVNAQNSGIGNCLQHGTYIFPGGIGDCNTSDYYLIFEDNFDGDEVDWNKWDVPWQGQMNDFAHERQNVWLANSGNTPPSPYSHNMEVSNGTLKLIARREDPFEGTIITDLSTTPYTTSTSIYEYTTGWLQTDLTFYLGKYEARLKLPKGKGFWPAFWVFGGVKWNEIDFMEIHDEEMEIYTNNVLHDWDNIPNTAQQCPYADGTARDFSEWHTFTAYFKSDRIVFYLDNQYVRTVPRYQTLTGDAIFCGDASIAAGTYFEQKAWPLEPMNIILNLSVQSNQNSPNENTPFPAVFEVDYVRFWAQEQSSCEGCIDHISFNNTNNLPGLSRASTFIRADENVTVEVGQNVTFKAPVIELTDGFTTEVGGVYEGVLQECSLYNYQETDIEIIDDNLYEGASVLKCTDPIYRIEVIGATSYSGHISNTSGQVLHTFEGEPTSNWIELWNANSASQGWYNVTLQLANCSHVYNYEYQFGVADDCGKSLIADSTNATNRDTKNPLVDKLHVYPNPTSSDLNIEYTLQSSSQITFLIEDIYGKDVLKNSAQCDAGKITRNLDVNSLPAGTYILALVTENEVIKSKFVISR